MDKKRIEKKKPHFLWTTKLPFIIPLLSCCLAGSVVFAVLAPLCAEKDNETLAIVFTCLACFFTLICVFFAVHSIYILKKNSKEIQEAATAFMEQLNTFEAGRVRLLNKEYNNKALEKLQYRINSIAAKFNERNEDENVSSEEKFYSEEDFPDALHSFIHSSSSYAGAFVAIDTVGGDDVPEAADEALLRTIRLIFAPSIITKKKNGRYNFYSDKIGSQATFKAKAEQLIRTFNYTEIRKESGMALFYTAKVGAALFPYNPDNRLASVAEKNLKKANPISVSGNDGVAVPLPYAGIGDKPKRALLLSANENFIKGFLNAASEQEMREIVTNAIDYYCLSMEFSTGGIILYKDSLGVYSIFLEHTANSQEERGLSLFSSKNMINESLINPIFEKIGGNGVFFIDDITLLPYQVSEKLQSIGAASVILFPVSYGGKKKGLAYLVSDKKKSGQDLMERESADAFFSLISTMVVSLSEQSESKEYQGLLDSLADRDEKKFYMVDPVTYKLRSFSKSLEKAFPNIKKGDICYKAIMGSDSVCDKCPLKGGSMKRSIPQFGANEQVLSPLFTSKGKGSNYSTILIEGEEKTISFSSNLFDKEIGAFTPKAFSSEINKEIRTRGSGIALAFRVTNMSELLSRFKDETNDSVLRAMSSLIQDEGYGNILYRYDEETLILLLKSMNKMGMIAIAEEISNIFSYPLQLNGNQLNLKLAYSSVGYPSEASANFEMNSLIGSELTRSAALGEGMLCEVGRNRVRKANRKQYILQLLQESIAHNQISMRLSSIVDTPSRKSVGIEFTLGLTGYANEEISKKEFLNVANEANIIKDLDIRALLKVNDFYKNYYDSTLKPNGANLLCLTMSLQTILSPTFLETIKKIYADSNMPKGMLVIALESRQVTGVEEELGRVIKDVKAYGVSFSAHSFDPNNDSVDKLHDLGFRYVRISRNALQTAMASQSANSQFIRMAAEFDEKSLIAIVNRVTDQEQMQFCLDMAMPYYIDGGKANSLHEAEFITYLNFKR